ncbi:phosphatidate cytidylyltransferase [Candidatus Nitrosacidococcus sp. I8]|uniref:phosphatidate cytidylyltransferase n=1 Tax=Candidatus Nitrosacidococcus sp. I8 TaxID=2942908 RepID=UPI0022263439|nr:phosphatidate cytidylyltransferase [Candidatus Nitrosacidococcus sp. I8]CAH9017460.1 Phosphatidate cytidylyltransferase [Candidatus Nitrosacidococcus sp. I8]
MIGAIYFLSTQTLALVFAIITIMGAWEWGGLIKIYTAKNRYLYIALILLSLLISWIIPLQWVLIISIIWWNFCLLLLIKPFQKKSISHPISKMEGSVIGFLILVPAWRAIIYLHSLPTIGSNIVLFLFALIWLADSGAYMAGRKFGHTKLAPMLSPGKTWEGVYGALIICSLYLVVSTQFFEFSGKKWWLFIALGLATVLFSIVGDLLESLFKRVAAVKDSSSLLPGHGGILDRIDSLTAAVPIFTFGFLLLERLDDWS